MVVLNLGCGEDFYGDIRVDLYRSKATTDVYDVEQGIHLPDNSVDEVLMRNLLEHLKNPFNVLSEAKRVLKPGGRIIVITDNAAFLPFYRPLQIGGYPSLHMGGYSGRDKRDKHFAVFTIEHVLNFLTAAGFCDIKLKYISYDQKDFGPHFAHAPVMKNLIFRILYEAYNVLRFLKLTKHFTYPRIVAEAVKPHCYRH